MLKKFEFYAWLCDFKFSDLGYVLISRKNYRLVKINLPKKYRRELCLCLGQLDIFLINLKIRFCYSKLDIHTHVLPFYAVLIWEFSWFGFFPKCFYWNLLYLGTICIQNSFLRRIPKTFWKRELDNTGNGQSF